MKHADIYDLTMMILLGFEADVVNTILKGGIS
jgi:hypothetical protein